MTSLEDHLTQVAQDSSVALDASLLQTAEFLIAPTLSDESTRTLALQVSRLLPLLRQDPTPAIKLLLRLFHKIPFSDIRAIDPNLDLAAGLALDAQPFHGPTISVLKKAANNAADAESLASIPSVIHAVVRLWLSSPVSGVASKAQELLIDLLHVDRRGIPEVFQDDPGVQVLHPGAVWRRIFGDRDVYGLIFSICSFKGSDVTNSQRSQAQARLLEFLPKVAGLHWNTVARSQQPEVEVKYDLKRGEEGLLHFAALHMIDPQDTLMHVLQVQFFTDLLTKCSHNWSDITSRALQFLLENGLHEIVTTYYCEPDQSGLGHGQRIMLYPACAIYLSTYAALYPEHFLSGPYRDRVLKRLSFALNAGYGGVQHDLRLLSSVPRACLIPHRLTRGLINTPIGFLHSLPKDAALFDCLAVIFHGPIDPSDLGVGVSDSRSYGKAFAIEKVAARILFLLITPSFKSFWTDITSKADLPDDARTVVSATNVMTAVMTANWLPSPTGSPSESGATDEDSTKTDPFNELAKHFPSESDLQQYMQSTRPLPQTGLDALMDAGSRISDWILKEHKVYSVNAYTLESDGYQIQMAKHGLAKTLRTVISKQLLRRPDLKGFLERLEIAIARGPHLGGDRGASMLIRTA
jgi:hypothetical protein